MAPTVDLFICSFPAEHLFTIHFVPVRGLNFKTHDACKTLALWPNASDEIISSLATFNAVGLCYGISCVNVCCPCSRKAYG